MRHKSKGAAVLLTVFIIATTLTAIVFSLTMMLTSETREVGYRASETQAFYLAEAGIAKATLIIQTTLEATYLSSRNVQASLAYLNGLANTAVISEESFGPGTFTVQVTTVKSVAFLDQRDVTMLAIGRVKGTEKRITVVQTFGFAHSKVFDHSYFINNYGWLYGGAQNFNGDVRANGAFKVIGSQKINGDVYATQGVDESQGNLQYDSISNYYANSGNRSRPGDPTAPGGQASAGGYDGFADNYDAFGNPRNPADPQVHSAEEVEDMPYLGDLAYYQQLAVQNNGTVAIGGRTQINNVYNGNIALIGTVSNPIVINGPVVVTGDVVIKGVVKGQGTIYAGRNTHIIGNLTYQNPPTWPKPDYNPDATSSANVTKDFLGLSAKGNIVLGDYTSSGWNYVKNWIQPPFTQPYVVDQTDASIGYVKYYQDGKPMFDGNYTAFDGGRKTDNTSRRYYESTFGNGQWRSFAPTNYISQINALIYTNHAAAGRVSNVAFNGSVVGRDDGIVFSGSLVMNFDYRVLSQGRDFIDLKLPISLITPIRKSWK